MNTIHIDCLSNVNYCFLWQITIVRNGTTTNIFNVSAYGFNINYVVDYDTHGSISFGDKFTLSIVNDFDEYSWSMTVFAGGGPFISNNPAALIEDVVSSFYQYQT